MRHAVELPILIPFATAIGSLLAGRWRGLQRWISVVGTLALLIVGLMLLATVWQDGIRAVQIGNWPAPFGITLVADLFSAIMVVLTGLTGLATVVYSLASIDRDRERFGYYPLLQILLMGVCGAFLTGDIFNLFVWFEVMLIASFVLLALGGERAQIEGAIKYVTINLVSSALFLTAVGLLYGLAGTLNMADLSVKLSDVPHRGLVTTVAILFFVSFGIKAAVFPLFFWLPASYHTPPVAVSAIFAGLLTKVGVYALLRVFTLIFTQDVNYTHTLILVVAGLTMITGVLGAVTQNEFRRILSFHIISQIGYMIMGLGLFTPLALAGSIFYIMHHIIVKANLFLVSGVVYRLKGSYELKKLGGGYQAAPGVAIMFLIPALSLAGMPPLSGFWAKLTLVQAGLSVESYIIVAAALTAGLLTLFSMTKIWAEVFWKPAPEQDRGTAEEETGASRSLRLMVLPIVALALVTLIIGTVPAPFFELSVRAAEQLLNPEHYIRAVLKTP